MSHCTTAQLIAFIGGTVAPVTASACGFDLHHVTYASAWGEVLFTMTSFMCTALLACAPPLALLSAGWLVCEGIRARDALSIRRAAMATIVWTFFFVFGGLGALLASDYTTADAAVAFVLGIVGIAAAAGAWFTSERAKDLDDDDPARVPLGHAWAISLTVAVVCLGFAISATQMTVTNKLGFDPDPIAHELTF